MKLFSCLMLSIGLLSPLNQELKWFTDFDQAKKLAKQENKLLLMRFTGSDWCANCIRIDTTLIETPQFEDFARKNFVLLYLDFPSKAENKLSSGQAAHNQRLQEIYNPSKAFPALLVLDSEGNTLGSMNVRRNTTEWYLNNLREIMQKRQ